MAYCIEYNILKVVQECNLIFYFDFLVASCKTRSKEKEDGEIQNAENKETICAIFKSINMAVLLYIGTFCHSLIIAKQGSKSITS